MFRTFEWIVVLFDTVCVSSFKCLVSVSCRQINSRPTVNRYAGDDGVDYDSNARCDDRCNDDDDVDV